MVRHSFILLDCQFALLKFHRGGFIVEIIKEISS